MRWANQLGVVLLGSVVASAVIFVACGSTDSPDGATPDGGSGKGGTANGGTGAQGGSAAGSGGETGSNPVCVPGTTMECIGPGACRGGQSCNAEGTGYGTCDCGTGGVDGSDDAPTSNGDSSTD
jgi:hypothetical protein